MSGLDPITRTTRSFRMPGLALTLACLLAPALAEAGKPKAKTKPTPDTITLELREIEGKGDAEIREFVVPIHGKLAGSIQLFDQVHWCRVEARPSSEDRLRLDLGCYQGGRSGEHRTFDFEVERSFEVGAELMLGELELREGQRLQVVATRH